jgi:beta-glucuronidase
VARADGKSGDLTMADVHPWRPGEGYLYELAVELRTGDGSLVDAYPFPVGVRTVRVDGHRFLINGEPFYFRGFGKRGQRRARQ